MVSLAKKIQGLKERRDAVILAHNYQNPEIQDIADFVGDSLELAVKAAEEENGLLVFCGVRFMAETAKILSPRKRVLLPVARAGCPMADMIGPEELRALQERRPGAVTVCYVNSTVQVKAKSDITVTSANAVRIISTLPRDREIIFVPDRNLGAWVEKETGRRMILHPGCCPVHQGMGPDDIRARLRENPGAVVIAHPECPPETLALADRVLSTGGMCDFVRSAGEGTFIVATEMGIIHRLARENPRAKFVPVTSRAVCADMKLTALEDVLAALENLEPEIILDEDLRHRAELPIRRMLAGGIPAA